MVSCRSYLASPFPSTVFIHVLIFLALITLHTPTPAVADSIVIDEYFEGSVTIDFHTDVSTMGAGDKVAFFPSIGSAYCPIGSLLEVSATQQMFSNVELPA